LLGNSLQANKKLISFFLDICIFIYQYIHMNVLYNRGTNLAGLAKLN